MRMYLSFRAILVVLAVIGGLWGLAQDTIAGRAGFQNTSVEEIIGHHYAPPAYLAVQGQLLTSSGFTQERKRSGAGNSTIEAHWFPLVDGTQTLAILVQAGGFEANQTDSSVSGVLRPMPGKLRKAVLAAASSEQGGPRINTDYVLVRGSAPPGWQEWGAVAGASAIIGLLVFGVSRYRASASQPVPASMTLGLRD